MKSCPRLILYSVHRAFPSLLLPVDTDGNEPGFSRDESHLFLVVVNHEIVVEDRAESGTHERAGAVRIHGIGDRKGCSCGDHAVKAYRFNFGTIAIPVGGEHTDYGERADPDDSPLAGEPIGAFYAGVWPPYRRPSSSLARRGVVGVRWSRQ